MIEFSDRLLQWFGEHGRKDLPWQQSARPYEVWVSEIMLQQTQVQTVIPYYERFTRQLPDIASIARADIDVVLQLWSGLGYYARARNLHRAAQLICEQYAGKFPRTFEDVVALPGIGRSTAGAILSLAHDERHAILDGNVKRVLARHQAVAGWPGKTEVLNKLWSLAEANTPEKRVAEYTQAIMDLGATLCTRSNPACAACPVGGDCKARLSDAIGQFPGRKPKKAKPLKQITMVMAVNENTVYLERRPPAGIWGGLWSLPEVEDVDDWCRQVLQNSPSNAEPRDILRHSFSHFDLDIQPVVVRVDAVSRNVADNPDATWYALDDNPPGGIAAPVQKLINTLKTNRHVTNS
jgi:A/G-specific adenine glycosylase